MQHFLSLLLDVWREACRHIEIGKAVDRMVPLLAGRLPLGLVIVRRLDLDRGLLETVAATARGDTPVPSWSGVPWDRKGLEALLRWARQAEPLRGDAATVNARCPGLLSPGIQGEVIAGPLVRDGECVGVLILVADRGRSFGASHEKMASELFEPLGVALDNDRRLRELTRLREAVEADNRSLLSRLGRQDISESVVGVETGLRGVMERVALVAPSDAPVLILGETGSGKEVVARAIHKGSRRVSGPFLRVNCGAIPPELIDSELFGHERGSFTGAVQMRKGWFERADGGTLFLDEVGELPAAAQVRLLRIVQDGTFERVGGQQSLRVDVRVVAATNRDLATMVSEGLFREDLWYRIAVFPIHLPPLRDRVEDIPALAAHFALRAAKRLGTIPLVPRPEDNDLLVAYAWPGNVRELSAVIERAAILGDGKSLEVHKALGLDNRPGRPRPIEPRPEPENTDNGPSPIETLDEAVVSHIEKALIRTGGRVEGRYGAARLLGVNPHTLRSRMRRLKMDWSRFRRARESI